MKAYTKLASAYNELMTDVNYDEWAAYINSLLGKKNARIYETACGTGSISFRLYDMGHDIVASDVSEDMLREAVQAARETGRDIIFVRQDMCGFETGKKVDAVICVCDGVNYIDEKGFSQFAASAYRALNDGGVLLFDISTKAKLMAMDGQTYFDDADDVACIWQNAFDAGNDTLMMDVTLFIRKDGLFERFSETHVQHVHETDSLRRILEQAGFSTVNVYQFLTTETCPYDAPRAQFVCRKCI